MLLYALELSAMDVLLVNTRSVTLRFDGPLIKKPQHGIRWATVWQVDQDFGEHGNKFVSTVP